MLLREFKLLFCNRTPRGMLLCVWLAGGMSALTRIWIECKYMKHIFWTADERSNRRKILAVNTQLEQLRKESQKKNFRLERDSNPWPLRCRCSALPTELSSYVLTARIFLLFDLSSAVQNICFIYLHSFIHPSRIYYELTVWPAPSWLDSSVGRALHRHRRGHGFESRSSLKFFFGFLFATAQVAY